MLQPNVSRLPGERETVTSSIFENLLYHGPKFGFVARLIHFSMFAALLYENQLFCSIQVPIPALFLWPRALFTITGPLLSPLNRMSQRPISWPLRPGSSPSPVLAFRYFFTGYCGSLLLGPRLRIWIWSWMALHWIITRKRGRVWVEFRLCVYRYCSSVWCHRRGKGGIRPSITMIIEGRLNWWPKRAGRKIHGRVSRCERTWHWPRLYLGVHNVKSSLCRAPLSHIGK